MNNVYLFFGPPGSGKTAMAKRLKEQLGFEYISWGDISRDIVKEVGPYKNYSNLVKEIHKKNLPFPKGFVTSILKDELISKTKKNNIIIDGYPKRFEEALELITMFQELNLTINTVIRFNIDIETYLKRLRKKDEYRNLNEAELIKRYDIYIGESFEAINLLYTKANFYFDINASDDETNVFASLLSKLNNKSSNKFKLSTRVAETKLQTEFGEFDLIAFQHKITYEYHLVLKKGDIKYRRNVPIRVHSSCITGDIFHSFRCDCKDQLHAALKYIGNNDKGLLIYLFQEGRGINIINKIKAYDLQQQGRDTIEANIELGLPPELRHYEVVKDILDDFEVISVDLLTNNPDKISKLQDSGVIVEKRLPIVIKSNKFNKNYLATKKDRMNHLLP